MSCQVQKQVFEVWLTDFHPVQLCGDRGELSEAVVNIICFDFDKTQRFDDAMLKRLEIAGKIVE